MFFRMVCKSGQIFLPFCHNSRVWRTDGQTDGRTDRILITIPRLHYKQRGKNRLDNFWSLWVTLYSRILVLFLGSRPLTPASVFSIWCAVTKTAQNIQHVRRELWHMLAAFSCMKLDSSLSIINWDSRQFYPWLIARRASAHRRVFLVLRT